VISLQKVQQNVEIILVGGKIKDAWFRKDKAIFNVRDNPFLSRQLCEITLYDRAFLRLSRPLF
jgi:hypothetical protein